MLYAEAAAMIGVSKSMRGPLEKESGVKNQIHS